MTQSEGAESELESSTITQNSCEGNSTETYGSSISDQDSEQSSFTTQNGDDENSEQSASTSHIDSSSTESMDVINSNPNDSDSNFDGNDDPNDLCVWLRYLLKSPHSTADEIFSIYSKLRDGGHIE